MRVFAVLAFTVASVAGAGCASNCTQNILNSCTPRFQFEYNSDCFLLDLAPPKARLWINTEDGCGEDIASFPATDANLQAYTTNFDIVDNTLTFNLTMGCPTPAPLGNTILPGTLAVQFIYSGSDDAPVLCGSTCGQQKLKLYTNAEECETEAPESNDNEPAGTWGNRGSSSGRRSSPSGRRNSPSGRRSSPSTNDNDGGRREGCASNVLYNMNRTAVCQLGQCCGANFCRRDYGVGDCWATGVSNAAWLVGRICDDETCNPNQGDTAGQGTGQGGAVVTVRSSLDNAVGALPERGRLVVATQDVTSDTIPDFAEDILISFTIERQYDNETVISGYLPNGGFILVTVAVDFLDGDAITVFRWDVDTETWVDTLQDCIVNGAGEKEIEYNEDTGVYSVPICHTSEFIVAYADDCDEDTHDHATHNHTLTKSSKDAPRRKAGHKHKKKCKTQAKADKKKAPTKKNATESKTKKASTEKKEKVAKEVKTKSTKAGKGKAIAIGVGVAGGAVVLAGVGMALRRANKKKGKKPTTGAAPRTTGEVAIVSV